MGKKIDNKDRPYVSNYPPLAKFLAEREARCMWQLPLGSDETYGYPPGYVELHMFPSGRAAIVVVHAQQHGWEIYTPGSSLKIDESLADAAARLGLEVKP
jgi:hypothetical protein